MTTSLFVELLVMEFRLERECRQKYFLYIHLISKGSQLLNILANRFVENYTFESYLLWSRFSSFAISASSRRRCVFKISFDTKTSGRR